MDLGDGSFPKIEVTVDLSDHRSAQKCITSAKNAYVAFLDQNDSEYHVPRDSDKLVLLPIDAELRYVTQVEVPLPHDMIETSIKFHPSLPLILIE